MPLKKQWSKPQLVGVVCWQVWNLVGNFLFRICTQEKVVYSRCAWKASVFSSQTAR
jgi:hypothetical protein